MTLGLAASFVVSAHAQTNQWNGFHIGLNAGGGFGNVDTSANFQGPRNSGIILPDSPLSPENHHFGTSGFIGGGQFGYDTMIGGLVVGAVVDFSGSTINGTYSASGVDSTGPTPFTETQKSQLDWLSTLRARFGYEVVPGWLPYITGGLAFGKFEGSERLTGIGTTYQSTTSTIRTGGVVGAGLDYRIMPNWTVGLEYLHASFGKFGTPAPSQQVLSFTHNTTFEPELNIIRVGFDWHFGAPSAAPPAVTPAVAAPPAPPPAVVAPSKQMFIVFFEFDKSSLTPDGRKVVDGAAAAFKRGKSGIAIAGYTDLAGTQQYNLALSKRRADAVKTALIRDGVPALAIDESWHGKDNPRVPTADGVREPQNRRVEITM